MSAGLAALVVLYKPDREVIQNVGSYLSQVEKLYIFDNSEQPNLAIKAEILSMANHIVWTGTGVNLGIGEALHYGAVNAKADGFHWLLTMDQDSSFSDDKYFQAWKTINDKSEVAIFSPNQVFPLRQDLQWNGTTEEVIVMTSGNLLNLDLYNIIGPFAAKLFIDEIDHDYCLKAKKMGYRVLRFPNIKLNHELGSTQIVTTSRKERKTTQHAPFRVYYIVRNNFYIFWKYGFSFPGFMIKRVLNLVILFRNIIFFQDKKLSRIRYSLLGFFHFMIGRYGKL